MPEIMSFPDYLDWLSKNQSFFVEKKKAAKRQMHPGRILYQEYLFPRKVTQTALAKKIGCTHAKVNEIINGKRNITAEFALDLERVLGVPADYWVSLQASFELDQLRAKRL